MFKIIILLSSIILLVGNQYNEFVFNSKFKIHFLDVGQGDAILIVTPDSKYILVDGGVSGTQLLEELGNVMPFWERNIDYVVATHGDADHITGLVDVAERYRVGQFIHNGKDKQTLTYKTLIKNFEKNGVTINSVDDKDDFSVGCCVWIDTIWPKSNANSDLSDNDTSVSMIVDYKNFEVYLAGDLSAEYEIEAVETVDVDIELFKASHHGSKSSTSVALIEKLTPEIAILSYGKDNKYGHPHPEVLNILKEMNLKMLSTEELGTISMESDGKDYWIK